MKHRIIEVTLLACLLIGTGLVWTTQAQPNVGDPCRSVDTIKLSVVLNLSSTGGEVLPVSGNSRIYTCGFVASVAGTTPSLKFRYGTGTACGTGSTDLTGVILPAAGTVLSYTPSATAFSAPAGQALCVVLAGTSPSVQGVLTYVRLGS